MFTNYSFRETDACKKKWITNSGCFRTLIQPVIFDFVMVHLVIHEWVKIHTIGVPWHLQ